MATHRVEGMAAARPPINNKPPRSKPIKCGMRSAGRCKSNASQVFESVRTHGPSRGGDRHSLKTGNRQVRRPSAVL